MILIHNKINGIIFDRDYSNALLGAALRDGILKLKFYDDHKKNLADALLRKSRLKKKSLELALLFDEIHLNDPFKETSALKKLVDEGVITSWINPNDSEKRAKILDVNLANDIKPLIFNYLIQLYQRTRPAMAKNKQLVIKLVYALYDFLILWRAGFYEEAIQKTSLPLNKIFHGKGNILNVIDREFEKIATGQEGNGFIADLLLLEFEISSTLSLIQESQENRYSFATTRVHSIYQTSDVRNLHSAYSLCLLPMQEEIKYAPVVESIQDLIRLRERSEIKRFREVLSAWKSLLCKGEIDLAENIRADIIKANREISKLEKWKTVDKWFYYLTLPTMFVPIVSNIINVGSVYTRFHIGRYEKKFGWIGIAK